MSTQNTNLILGPPGTGKTTTLLNLVEERLAAGMDPQRIAFVSFTRKAAHEAADRACMKFDLPKSAFRYFRTLHSLAFEMLGLKKIDVMSDDDWRRLGITLGLEFTGAGVAEDGSIRTGGRDGDLLLFHWYLARARFVTLEEQHNEALTHAKIESLKMWTDTVAKIEKYKADSGLVDFSDMLDNAMRHPPLDIDLVIIDEAQDLSAQQWQFCDAVFAAAKEWYIAGDDDQAIYQWSGADVSHFLQLKAKTQVLNHSYRLPRTIWQYSRRISARIENRFRKKWTPREGEGLVQPVTKASHAPIGGGGEWLFLFRNNYFMKPIEEGLLSSGIPFLRGLRSSVDVREVRAIRAWEALQRNETISIVAARDLYTHLLGNVQIVPGMKDSLNDAPVEWEYDQKLLVDKFGFRANLQMSWKKDSALRISDEKILHYKRADERGESLTDKPRVRLSTIHGVKGGECDNVVLFDAVSKASRESANLTPDDEHRVFYVGATRARNSLYVVTSPKLVKSRYSMPK